MAFQLVSFYFYLLILFIFGRADIHLAVQRKEKYQYMSKEHPS